MKLIAAVDKNWAIGNKGQLLVSIPQDQKMFRDETMGKVIVMGRKTLESLPGAQPLYGRTNIVLTADPDYRVKGASVCGSVEEVMELLRAYHTDDVYIIGGESVGTDHLDRFRLCGRYTFSESGPGCGLGNGSGKR